MRLLPGRPGGRQDGPRRAIALGELRRIERDPTLLGASTHHTASGCDSKKASPLSLIQQSSEYAIRALTYLALRHGDGYVLVREIGPELDVPVPYLAKVLQPLVARGMLESQRGRGGGYRLARSPEEIRLYDIVDALEPLGGPRRCLLGQSECSDERACPLHDLWKETSEAFLARLTGTTLQDVLGFCERRPESGYPGQSPAS